MGRTMTGTAMEAIAPGIVVPDPIAMVFATAAPTKGAVATGPTDP